MAVYSTIEKQELLNLLKNYNIGSLTKFEGILEGVENTNYKITTSKNIYILTIFEKRVLKEDLPFFFNLKNHLINKNFNCPKPVLNNKGENISIIKNKSCVLISYLEGSKINNVTENHCYQVGEILSLLHKYTNDFKQNRENKMSYFQWENIYTKCKKSSYETYPEIFNLIERELLFIKNNWPNNIPRGVIHADVFQDNVFFKNNKFSGLIDFYFACNDFLSYDLALTINAWCFKDVNKIDIDKFLSLVNGYQKNRLLNEEEKNSLSVLLRGAALRILLTRLHDKIFHSEGAFLKPKNPEEFLYILRYHQKKNIIDYLK
jgi:homoserine kinase type II